MNKKNEIMFVGFMIVLFSFLHYFFVFLYIFSYEISSNLIMWFFFLSIFISPMFLLIIARLEEKKRNTVLKTSDNTKLQFNILINSFFLFINSILIIGTIIVSVYEYPTVIFLILPLFAGFNILWVITKLKLLQNGQNNISNLDKIGINKKTPINAILIIIEAMLLPFIFFYVINDFNPVLEILMPTLILVDVSWIFLISKWKNGDERDRIIFKIILSLFGFNLFWNIFGFRIIFFFGLSIPLTISGIIYTLLQLGKINKMNSNSFESNHEDLMDEHLDLMRKLNGNK